VASIRAVLQHRHLLADHLAPVVVGLPTVFARDRQHYGRGDDLRMAPRLRVPQETLHPALPPHLRALRRLR
jgi:hypothetical protein